MAISHIPRSVGHNFVPEYQISAIPYVRKGVIANLDITSTSVVNGQNVFTVSFPKITQWLQFKASAEVHVYFSAKDASIANEKNCMILGTNRTFPLDVRCTKIYFHEGVKGSSVNLEIVAGLTVIDSAEFNNVVETFLEGQP